MLRFGLSLAVVLAMHCGAAAAAQTKKPVEAAKPAAGPERKAAEPATTTLPAKTPPAPDVWSPADIESAKAQCAAALKGLNVLVSYEEPIKQGDCGNPAPIRLVRLDNVTFSPPALINCGMLSPLHTWITRDLQPLARRKLGSKIASIEVMSDYSCRTAFGRVGKKLSQHAYIDALDIRGFVTDKNQQVSVLASWGATARDIAAAKAREEKIVRAAHAAASAQAMNRTGSPENLHTGKQDAVNSAPQAKRAQSDVDVVTAILPGGTKRQQVAARLGGPADKTPPPGKPTLKPSLTGESIPPLSRAARAALETPSDTPRAHFLREAHAAACRIFGTTLGPDANEMHRNHFHVDMAQRKIKNICD